MSNFGHNTEGEILRAWAWRQIEGGQTQSSFACALADAYLKHTPDGSRTLPLENPDDYPLDADSARATTSNRKNVERWLKGSQPIPADLVYAWTQTLLGGYRDGCLSDLFGRYGLLPVEDDTSPDTATIGKMMSAMGNIAQDLVSSPAQAVGNIRQLRAGLAGLEIAINKGLAA